MTDETEFLSFEPIQIVLAIGHGELTPDSERFAAELVRRFMDVAGGLVNPELDKAIPHSHLTVEEIIELCQSITEMIDAGVLPNPITNPVAATAAGDQIEAELLQRIRGGS